MTSRTLADEYGAVWDVRQASRIETLDLRHPTVIEAEALDAEHAARLRASARWLPWEFPAPPSMRVSAIERLCADGVFSGTFRAACDNYASSGRMEAITDALEVLSMQNLTRYVPPTALQRKVALVAQAQRGNSRLASVLGLGVPSRVGSPLHW